MDQGNIVDEDAQVRTTPIWAPLAIFAGTTTSTAWLATFIWDTHDSVESPNATSIGLKRSDELLRIIERLPSALEIVLGIVGLLFLFAGIAYLVRGRRWQEVSSNDRLSIVICWLAGAVLGFCWWAVTYGTVDANIGGGLALMFGLPGSVVMIALALYELRYGRTRRANPKPSQRTDPSINLVSMSCID